MYYTVDIIGKTYFQQFKDWLPTLFSAIIMGVGVYLSTYLTSSPVLQLLIGFSVGVLIYTGMAFLLKLEAKDTIINQIRKINR